MADQWSKILVGSDFTEESAVACRYAAQLARLAGAELHLFHAFHVAQGDMMDDRGRKMHFDDAQKRVRDRLDQVVAEHMDGYPKVKIEVRLGSPAKEMLAYAEEIDPDIVVTATHTRSKIKKQLLGSVADEVARHVRCPTLIVPPELL